MTRLLVAVTSAMLLLTAAAPGAAASDTSRDRIMLSLDGVTYSPSLTQPLFDPTIRWVPGDVRTERFFIGNRARTPGRMDLFVEGTGRDALNEGGHLRVAARVGDRPFTDLSVRDGVQLLDGVLVGPGQDLTVDVRVRLGIEAPNNTRLLGSDLDFSVQMQDARVVDPTTPDGPDGPGGPQVPGGPVGPDSPGGTAVLPDTGSRLAPWLLPLALALFALGNALILHGRRRKGTSS